MNVSTTPYYTQIDGIDDNGEFSVSIQSDCSQLRIESGDNDTYIDLNYNELKTIRDSITQVLEEFEKLYL